MKLLTARKIRRAGVRVALMVFLTLPVLVFYLPAAEGVALGVLVGLLFLPAAWVELAGEQREASRKMEALTFFGTWAASTLAGAVIYFQGVYSVEVLRGASPGEGRVVVLRTLLG